MAHPAFRRPTRLHRLETALLLALAAVLGGCAAGPDWHPPSAPAADAYRTVPAAAAAGTPGAAGQPIDTTLSVRADWYRLLGSPAIDRLVGEALAASPTLAAARARFEAARHELDAARGGRAPGVDAGLGASRRRGTGAAVGVDSPFLDNVFDLYTAHVSVRYALDLAGGESRSIEKSAAQARYAEDRLRGARITLVNSVVVTSLKLALLRDETASMRAIAASEKRTLAIVRSRERAGAVSQADTLRARAALAGTRARLHTLEKQLDADRTRLAVLLGKTPESFHAPALALAGLALPRRLPLSVPSQLVRQRPDILAAEASLHAANAAVGVAVANLYPHLTLTAGYGRQGSDAGSLFDPPAAVWNLGTSLLYPLFHGGELRARKAAAESRFDAAYAAYRRTVLEAFEQVADVLGALDRDAATLADRRDALAAADAGRGIVAAQYRAGAADFTDLLSSEWAYRSARIDELKARAARYQDTAALYQALGGGWWNAAPAPGSTPAAHAARTRGTH